MTNGNDEKIGAMVQSLKDIREDIRDIKTSQNEQMARCISVSTGYTSRLALVEAAEKARHSSRADLYKTIALAVTAIGVIVALIKDHL